VAGTLAKGGAEKQFTYMARALAHAGVNVRVYSFTLGEHFEAELRAGGTTPLPVAGGRRLQRSLALVRELRRFRPDLVQASHSFVNPYVALAGRLCGALSIGAIRNDGHYEARAHGVWRQAVLRAPLALLVNSETARRNLLSLGLPPSRVHLLRNVIDLPPADRTGDRAGAPRLDGPCVIAVGRLAPEKRLDRFVAAVALARRQIPELTGYVVGEGPLRPELERQAAALGLHTGLRFLGAQSAIPALLSQAAGLVLTSTQEGTPNVVLEAMAARRPVITTEAGDAGTLVRQGETGYVVGFDDVAGLSERIVQIASSPDLARRLGQAGYAAVQQEHDAALLPPRLLGVYGAIARQAGRPRVVSLLAGHARRWGSGDEIAPAGALEEAPPE
jgi:glycosyltransferase involved in cell wall biosynthesis